MLVNFPALLVIDYNQGAHSLVLREYFKRLSLDKIVYKVLAKVSNHKRGCIEEFEVVERDVLLRKFFCVVAQLIVGEGESRAV